MVIVATALRSLVQFPQLFDHQEPWEVVVLKPLTACQRLVQLLGLLDGAEARPEVVQ